MNDEIYDLNLGESVTGVRSFRFCTECGCTINGDGDLCDVDCEFDGDVRGDENIVEKTFEVTYKLIRIE